MNPQRSWTSRAPENRGYPGWATNWRFQATVSVTSMLPRAALVSAQTMWAWLTRLLMRTIVADGEIKNVGYQPSRMQVYRKPDGTIRHLFHTVRCVRWQKNVVSRPE